MGDWREVSVSRRFAPAPSCALCGRPIFGRAWWADAGGAPREFCEPECEALYIEYWLPRHGAATAAKD